MVTSSNSTFDPYRMDTSCVAITTDYSTAADELGPRTTGAAPEPQRRLRNAYLLTIHKSPRIRGNLKRETRTNHRDVIQFPAHRKPLPKELLTNPGLA